jgi:hypothetical protein
MTTLQLPDALIQLASMLNADRQALRRCFEHANGLRAVICMIDTPGLAG